MGVMGRVLGAGARGVGGVAEVFVGNRAERDEAAAKALMAAVAQHGAEFARVPAGRFDRFMDGLNRLPRPMLTIGTVGLFVYAMVAPAAFSVRMEGLALVPEPLWWLLGAIVSFYFGARELHYMRSRVTAIAPVVAVTAPPSNREPEPETAEPAPFANLAAGLADPDRNPALEEWRRLRG
jgi:hypothetical protein